MCAVLGLNNSSFVWLGTLSSDAGGIGVTCKCLWGDPVLCRLQGCSWGWFWGWIKAVINGDLPINLVSCLDISQMHFSFVHRARLWLMHWDQHKGTVTPHALQNTCPFVHTLTFTAWVLCGFTLSYKASVAGTCCRTKGQHIVYFNLNTSVLIIFANACNYDLLLFSH